MSYLSITGKDVFGAMDLSRPALDEVRQCAAEANWEGAEAAWGRYWASREAPQYYVDAETYARGVSAHLPQIRQIVIASAEAAMSESYQHATYKPRRVGNTFQWIDDNPDTAYIGFLYFWFIKNFGRAYALTGHEKFAQTFRDVVCSFWDATPRFPEARSGACDGLTVFWNNGLGSSLRCMFLMDCYWLMRSSASLSPELHGKILRVFLSHARYIHENHMQRYNHSNFQASQAAWMMLAGVMFPEFREAAAWRKTAVARIRERILRNFDEDGAQLEQCPQYHLTGMRDITRALMILDVNDMDDLSRDPELWRRFERVYAYPIRITHPTGHLAVFNSGVYGTEAQVFFPIGFRLFGSDLQAWAVQRHIRPGFVPVAKNLSEYVMFMDGAWTAAVQDARQRPCQPPGQSCEVLPDSGLAVLRSGWDKAARSLVFDFNRDPWGRHRHFGRLSFDLFAYGRALVVNPGSTISYSMPVYRSWCYQTVSHNTVRIGGKSHDAVNAQPAGWGIRPHTTFVSARMHTNGLAYQRTIVQVDGAYYVVLDQLRGGGPDTQLEWLLHSPQPMEAGNRGVTAAEIGQPGLLIRPDSLTLTSSATTLDKGYGAVPVSYREGYRPLDAWREDIPYLRLESAIDPGLGGQTYAVVLAPFPEAPPDVQVLHRPVPGTSRLDVYKLDILSPDHTDTLRVDSRGVEVAVEVSRTDREGRLVWREE